MLEPNRLSIHQVTLPPQLATPQFLEVLARHRVPAASLWREKTRAHGVAATAKLVADLGIAMTGYCFGGLIASPDAAEAARARDDVRRALDEAAELARALPRVRRRRRRSARPRHRRDPRARPGRPRRAGAARARPSA